MSWHDLKTIAVLVYIVAVSVMVGSFVYLWLTRPGRRDSRDDP